MGATSRILDLGAGRPQIEVLQAGDGPDLLFLHGAGGIPSWTGALPLLGPGWRHSWWLRDEFEVILDAAEEGMRKPAPEIYLRVAERLGLAPERCVFVDDLTVNCEGAAAVGMRPFRFDVTDSASSTRGLLDWLLPGKTA